MSILYKQRRVRLVFTPTMPLLPLNFFPSPLSKTLSFTAYHQTCLRKMMILDLFTVGSS